jgi:hypothetical protein
VLVVVLLVDGMPVTVVQVVHVIAVPHGLMAAAGPVLVFVVHRVVLLVFFGLVRHARLTTRADQR